MAVFLDFIGQTTRHGVFGILVNPPVLIAAIGTVVAAIVGQFDWGPDRQLVSPDDNSVLLDTFAPAGFSRTTTGMQAITAKRFANLRVVRVLGSTAAAATCALVDGVTTIVTLTAKYKGAAGNSIDAAVSAASDADANHFKLTVTMTGDSGTTTETYDNLNYSGVGTAAPAVLTNSKLLASVTLSNAGRPDDDATVDFTGGTNGTIDATAYIGTPEASDFGIAALEGDPTIAHVFVDDCGDSIRAAVNEGLEAHGNLLQDGRKVYINGNKGLSVSAAVTQINTINSRHAVCVDSWVRIYDLSNTLVEVPSAPFAACVASRLPPSLSIAWKDKVVGEMLSGIQGLVSPRGSSAVEQISAAGGVALIYEDDGTVRFEAGLCSNGELLTTSRMQDYIIISGAKSMRPYSDAPNIQEVALDEVGALKRFLANLKSASAEWQTRPFIVDYTIHELKAANPSSQVAQGIRVIAFDVQTAPDQKQLYLQARIGPTVVIEEREAA